MSLQDTQNTPSYLDHTDWIATQWQDLSAAGRPRADGLDLHLQRLAQADGHSGLREDHAAPRPAGISRYVAPPVEFIGGICLVLGLATRYAALVMLLFVIIATFSSHRYWTYPEAQQANQSSHFWKNMALKGGLLFLFITGAGRYALDRVLARR